MNIIVDYGRGNLKSLQNALKRINMEFEISSDPETILKANSLIIPGVGAFKDAMNSMKQTGMDKCIIDFAKTEKPILGICLGMQLLYQKGYEYGVTEGLGLIKGNVEPLRISKKVPHMGWNNLKFKKSDPILKYIESDDFVYFVHSYYAVSSNQELIAYSEYEVQIPAIVRSNNIYGIQFHPEKSADVGEKILIAYKELVEERVQK